MPRESYECQFDVAQHAYSIRSALGVIGTYMVSMADEVLCKSMGFVGAQKSGSTSSCSAFNGQNFCGSSPPLVSEVACAGDETEITACPHEAGSDVTWLFSKLLLPSEIGL